MITTQTDINIIHHAGLIHSDLNFLSADYEKLGFLLTPVSHPRIVVRKGEPPAEIGVGNRCAIFRKNYLELLGVTHLSRWSQITPEQRGAFNIDLPLSRYPGLHVMHFGTSQIAEVKKRFERQGTPSSPVMPFQRTVDTPEGSATMRARALSFPPFLNPEGLIQIAQHDTPELIFQPRYMDHPNGAIGLQEVIVCCDEPEAYARKYQEFTAQIPERIRPDHFQIDLGESVITIVTPERLGEIIPGCFVPVLPFLAALSIESVNLELTELFLISKKVCYFKHNDRIIVDSKEGCGCSVIFY